MTSHDVVAAVRRLLKPQGVTKVGHAGTLDPMATGVLVVCVGSATRLSDEVMHGIKGYRASVRLGVNTETYDAEGAVTATFDTSAVTPEAVQQALLRFVGQIDQVPPMYSAIKQGGKKLYDLARAGQTVERAPRRVTIQALTLLECALPDLVLDVVCGSGTYIRSLAYDLGEALGVGAHLTALSRTRSGNFRLEDAVRLDDLTARGWHDALIPVRTALADWPALTLTDGEIAIIRHGRPIPAPAEAPDTALAYDALGQVVAVVRRMGRLWQPDKVFTQS